MSQTGKMIHSRILEFLKTPDLVSESDLTLLESEIKKYPYIQNLKALHLFGIHQFQPENYQKELSKTAAYTTDKKILYQFINKKFSVETPISESETIQEVEYPKLTKSASEMDYSVQEQLVKKQSEAAKTVYVNGERNRILFEGEEDFLDKPSIKIDLEATIESGLLVTEKQYETENKSEFVESKDAEDFSKETIIDESNISSLTETSVIENEAETNFHEVEEFLPQTDVVDEVELTSNETREISISEFVEATDAENFSKETIIEEENIPKQEIAEVEDSSELSFHATADFLPNIQIQTKVQDQSYEVPKPTINKHEAEMQRLIAEVEAKLKANKKKSVEVTEEEVHHNTDINFAETHDSSFKKENKEEAKSEIEVVNEIKNEEIVSQEPSFGWRPMSISSEAPDSSLKKPAEGKKEEKPQIGEVQNEEIHSETTEKPTEERPVFNVSFLSDTTVITPKKQEVKEKIQETKDSEESSNVPGFISTWQSWLKIDRTQQTKVIAVSIEEIKTKAIDKFIENEPKISQLKEEGSFVVKEKSNDISHLMTETLANLYVAQKLYTKAINAYEILKEKHPEKVAYFEEKIAEVKDKKQNPN